MRPCKQCEILALASAIAGLLLASPARPAIVCKPGETPMAQGGCMPIGNVDCGHVYCPHGFRCGPGGRCFGGTPAAFRGELCAGGLRCLTGNKCSPYGAACYDPRRSHPCPGGFNCDIGEACGPHGTCLVARASQPKPQSPQRCTHPVNVKAGLNECRATYDRCVTLANQEYNHRVAENALPLPAEDLAITLYPKVEAARRLDLLQAKDQRNRALLQCTSKLASCNGMVANTARLCR